MNIKNIITTALLFTIVTTTGIMRAGKVLLHNKTGWNIIFKFAEPNGAATESQPVPSNRSITLGDTDDYAVRALSIRRSGMGSSVAAPWGAIDVNTLLNDTRNLLNKPLPNNRERNIIWEVYAGNVYGWGITVKEFISNKVNNVR